MIPIRTLASLALALCLSGCAQRSEEDPIVVAEIEKEFSLNMRESLGAPSRELLLDITTIKSLDCSNYTIQSAWRRQNNEVLLSLLRIAAPLACDGVASKITQEVKTGLLDLGNFKLAIDLRGALINRGILSNLSDRYRLRLDTEHGLIIQFKELMKIPPSALWGYVSYNPEHEEDALRFAQDLYALSQAANYQYGYYGYYTIGDKGLKVEGQPQDQQQKFFTFLRNAPANHEPIQQLVQQYRQQFPAGVTLVLNDGMGRTY